MRRILYVVIACAALARGAFCAPSFTQEDAVSLSSATLGCVLPAGAGYRMYFSSSAAFAVLSATSTDGLTWTVENGVRISTPAGGVLSSSITALGVYAGPDITSGPYRAYYVGISTDGLYSILSATSTDGLAWGGDGDFLLNFNGGNSRVLSLAPFDLGGGRAVLYYTRDNGDPVPDPGAFAVFAATSTDGGNSFSGETQVLPSTGIFSVAVSSLTDGTIRLFATAPLLSGTSAASILSADSSDGLHFGAAAQVFSTNPATNVLGAIAVARSTDTYSWRLYMNLRLATSATDYVRSAVTLSPVINSFSPAVVLNDAAALDFTLAGEIFSTTAPVVSITKGADSVPVTLVTRVSDIRLTVSANPNGAPIGSYLVTVTNPGGRSAALPNGLTVDFRPGFATVTDNLFRPLKGGKAKVDVTLFNPGVITARLYDLNGGQVKVLFHAQAAAGVTTFFWDGKTGSGSVAASGLYLLRVKGPKTDAKEKIVLIK